MLVTEMKKLDTKKYGLYIDYEPFSVVYASDIKRMKLKEDQEISDVELETFRREYLFKRAMNHALASLQYTEKCEMDIRKKLADAWFDSEIVEKTIDKLKKYGYLDDYRYACCMIRKYAAKKSKKAIMYQLMAKKVEQSIVERAFEDVALPDEYDILKENILQKYAVKEISDKREKIIAYYIRKGYSYYLVSRCLKDILLMDSCTFCEKSS